jgi:hypothetical protein
MSGSAEADSNSKVESPGIQAQDGIAPAAIHEPGMFAFYYPDNDLLNDGRPTPAAGMDV